MFLLLGQLIYTSFSKVGFQALSSAAISPEIRQAFVDQIVYQHWDSYNPPGSDYRAVYLYRISADQALFGWLYNDGADDLGRSHVPYFVCYYYAGELRAEQLETIFTCLSKGTATIVDRQSFPDHIESVVIPDHKMYQPVRSGVTITSQLRDRTLLALQQEKLFKLFVPHSEIKSEIKTSIKGYLEELTTPEVSASTAGGRQSEQTVLSTETYQQILLSKAKTVLSQAAALKLGIAVSTVLLLGAIASSIHLVHRLPETTFQPALTPPTTVQSNTLALTHTLTSSPVWSVILNRETLISGSEDRTIKLWNTETGTLLNTLSGHTDFVRSLALSDQTLISGSGDRTIKLWNLQTNQLIQTLEQNSPVWSIAVSSDSKTLISGSEDGLLKIWSLPDGTLRQTVRAHGSRIFSAVVSPDGTTIATSGLDRTIKLWNAQTGKSLRTLTGHNDAIRTLAFSPDGQFLVSGSWDKTVKLWNWRSGKLGHTFTEHTSRVVTVAVSLDGQTIVSGSIDNTIKLWSIQDRKLLQTLTAHKDWVLSVAIDANHIVSGSKDQTIRIWRKTD